MTNKEVKVAAVLDAAVAWHKGWKGITHCKEEANLLAAVNAYLAPEKPEGIKEIDMEEWRNIPFHLKAIAFKLNEVIRAVNELRREK